MKKGRIARLFKGLLRYVNRINSFVSVVSFVGILIGIIKPLRIWIGDILNYTVKTKIWIIIVLHIVTFCIIYIIWFLIKRKKTSCKFEITSSVQHKGNNINNIEMIVIKYNHNKNQVFCSWMENNKHHEKWFNQDALEEYIPYTPLPLPFL